MKRLLAVGFLGLATVVSAQDPHLRQRPPGAEGGGAPGYPLLPGIGCTTPPYGFVGSTGGLCANSTTDILLKNNTPAVYPNGCGW